MLILAVDTSSPAGSLAVLKGNRTIGTVSAWTEELYSSRMFRQLDFLLRELSLGLEQFGLFAVAVGPGSFTGLRVGLAAAKAWSEVYERPIAAVSTLEAVAAQSHSRANHVVSVLDARRGQVYFATYRRTAPLPNEGLLLEGEERVSTAQEMFQQLQRTASEETAITIITPVPELLNSSRSETREGNGADQRAPIHTPPHLQMEEASPILAPWIGRLGLVHASEGRLADPLELDANYIRRSDAELHWKAPAGT